jgi:glutamate racemase
VTVVMPNDAPIGMVDSGVGGLTVARAVLDQLPHEVLHYVGDTAHSPYGPKPLADLRGYTLAILDELVESGVKALVIACNSASSACLRDARERYDVPVVEAAAQNITVTAAACPRFAEFVERGITSGRQLLGLAEAYLAPLNAAGVDTLVLGCTHYPMLTGLLSVVMGDSVTLVSSADETAKDVYRVLMQYDLLRPDDAPAPQHVFRATGNAEAFARLSRRFLGPDLAAVAPALGGAAL